MSTTSGKAFDDQFEISCNGWVTDSMSDPITYGFYICTSPFCDDVSLFAPFQTGSSLEFIISAGNNQNEYFILWAVIMDQAGSAVMVEVSDLYISFASDSTNVLDSNTPSLSKREIYSANAQKAFDYVTSSWSIFNQTSNAKSAMTDIAAVITGIKSQCLSSTDVSTIYFYKSVT